MFNNNHDNPKNNLRYHVIKKLHYIEYSNKSQKKNMWLNAIPIVFLLVFVGFVIIGILPYQQLYPFNDTNHEYNIKIVGLAWDLLDDPVLNVLIVPDPTLSNWKDSNIENAKYGFSEWISCIKRFNLKYGYSHLENIRFEIDVSNKNVLIKENYDIIVNWTNQIDSKGAAGATVVLSTPEKRITKATITLPISVIKEGKDYILSETDLINIITDEIGHALGLGHVDFKNDVLHGYYDFPQEEYCHSTLDIYGLAMVYQYMDNNKFEAPPKSIVYLSETDIPFEYMEEKH